MLGFKTELSTSEASHFLQKVVFALSLLLPKKLQTTSLPLTQSFHNLVIFAALAALTVIHQGC